MDPVLGSVIVSFIAATGGVVIAIITGRNGAERLADKATIRAQRKTIISLGGNPDEVEV